MGELKKAISADENVLCRTHIGGQALIEGVMMRGKYNWAVAIRQPDGSIYTEEHDLASGREKNSWMYWPVVRGCTMFVESLALGYKALNISADHAYDFDDDEDEDRRDIGAAADVSVRGDAPAGQRGAAACRAVAPATACEASQPAGAGAPLGEVPAKRQEETSDASGESKGLGALMTVSMVVGLLLGIAIFVVVPAALSNLVLGEAHMNSAAWNVLDGVIRVAIFIAYIWLIGRMGDIRRLFQYHGAEHKTIHCFEHGLALTPENARQFPRLHVRCGTAFMIMVMIIAIFVYTVLGAPINALVDLTGVTEGPLRFVLVVATRIVLLPVIAGLSYEITVKWAGQHPDNRLVRIVLWPGMQMQRLTTNPPDDGMLECAIAAMEIVVAREEREAARRGVAKTSQPGSCAA